MKQIIYIPYGTKKYPLIITKSNDPDYKDIESAIHIECEEAGFNQERDMGDLGKILELLPELIAEQKNNEKKEDFLRIRISPKEKNQIEILAKQNGFTNISSFIRAKVIN